MRARNIKPGFFTNELLGTYDPIISMLFAGLWCIADKDGILEDRPLRIKAELFPYREGLDVNGYLTVLERDKFLTRYEEDGISYIQINNFGKHQNPHHTEKARGYPKPSDESIERRGTQGKGVLTPLSNSETTVPERSDSLIPDSLIPDSLIQVSGAKAPSSGLPANTDSPPVRLNGKKAMIEQVMSYLNLQARRNYRVSNPNGTPTAGALVIEKRLKEGYSVDQCKDVIAEKSNQWMGDEKMDQYLNPQTLFRKSNFDKYLTEAEAQQ